MFANPILIYSKYCKYSCHFLDTLSKTPLAENFQYINIDCNPQTGTRSEDFYTIKNILSQHLSYQLKTVPTIIVEKGEFILSGKDAFEWLKYKLNTLHNSDTSNLEQHSRDNSDDSNSKYNQQEHHGDPSGFSQHEMGSFSDIYSTFGLNASDTCVDAKNQCFQFLDDSFVSNNKSVRFDENDTKQNQQPQIQFQKKQNNKNPKNKTSVKEDELNSRYEEMMMQRKEMDKYLKPPDRY